MRLYDFPASANCYKVRLLLGLLGQPYKRIHVDIFGGDTLTEAYGALNPVRETPVLQLDDGTVVTQSPAILWYLAEATTFLPDDRLGRAQVIKWLAFEQERVMGGLGAARFYRLTGRRDVPARLERGADALVVLEAELATRAWLVGDACTIADLAVFGYGHRYGDLGLDAGEHLRAWIDRIRALPGFVDDLAPYGQNARPGAGRSIYG